MSLDGFVAGPNQSVNEPLGIGGERLHEWVIALEAWRRSHGKTGGEVNASTAVMEGGTTLTFVTDGIESALEQARRAADGKDVALSGGARAAQQYLAAGLIDEMQLHLVPTLLGGGERLFDGVDDLHGLALVETVATKNVTHQKFARK